MAVPVDRGPAEALKTYFRALWTDRDVEWAVGELARRERGHRCPERGTAARVGYDHPSDSALLQCASCGWTDRVAGEVLAESIDRMMGLGS